METDLSLQEMQKEWHGTLKSYVIGFTASLFLTTVSFHLTVANVLSRNTLMYTITGLAVLQAIFQLRFFLHLGQEAKPRWETLTFYFMLLLLLIIAIGSLWIMQDLNNRMMAGMAEMPEMTHGIKKAATTP